MTQSGRGAIQYSNTGSVLDTGYAAFIARWSNFSSRSTAHIIISLLGLTPEITRHRRGEDLLFAESEDHCSAHSSRHKGDRDA